MIWKRSNKYQATDSILFTNKNMDYNYRSSILYFVALTSEDNRHICYFIFI